ncbi:Nn.00g117540.m01.CDS01 [Neocucurbitaria sp. VM-36]
MSFPTQPAYVHYGTWDEKSRQHECMKWMEQYTNAVDRKAWDTEPSSNWFTSSHTLHKTTGETVSGGDASWTALRTEVYAPFSQHLHDPQFFVTWETEDGWESLVLRRCTGILRLLGDGGVRLDKSATYADPTAAVVTMLKRGMMKPEDLVK